MKYLFPFSEYWTFYAGFLVFILVMLLLDLFVFHKEAHRVSMKEATGWTIFWITLALTFNVLFYFYTRWHFSTDPDLLAVPGFQPEVAARRYALEFLTGFLIEKALSVDNIFVFIVVFNYFHIPDHLHHRVLFYGILGALVFRAIFIALGAALMGYHAVVIFFGVFLIFTGVKLLFQVEQKIEPERNPVVRLIKKFFPVWNQDYGDKFFIRSQGRLFVTPLFICLVFLELTDVIFAIDSVPAIFAVTKEPFIVFTSNIFAILGLRSIYFLLSRVMDEFEYLKYGLALILIFVGLKMAWLNDMFDGEFPIGLSLGIIGGLLAASILASLLFRKRS